MAATRLNPRIVSGIASLYIEATTKVHDQYFGVVTLDFGQDFGTTDYIVHVTPIVNSACIVTPNYAERTSHSTRLVIVNAMATSSWTATWRVMWTVILP